MPLCKVAQAIMQLIDTEIFTKTPYVVYHHVRNDFRKKIMKKIFRYMKFILRMQYTISYKIQRFFPQIKNSMNRIPAMYLY